MRVHEGCTLRICAAGSGTGVLEAFAVEGGAGIGGWPGHSNGGGIVNNGTLTIENITITGNSAQGSGGGPGARRRGRRGGPEKEEVSTNERHNYGEVACAPSP